MADDAPGSVIGLPVERIHVEVTNRCNFDCEFCPQGSLERASQDMDWELYTRICDQLAGGSIAREIHFHIMGEPLMYRRLAEAVAYAGARGVTTVVTTNGSLLTIERAQALMDAGLARLVVSLQTPDDESFKIRGAGNLTFDRYERTLSEAMRHMLSTEAVTEVVLAFRTTAFPRIQAPKRALYIVGDSATLRAHMTLWAERVMGEPFATEQRERLARLVDGAHVARWNVVRAAPRFTIESRPLGGWVKPSSGARFHPARFGTCHALAEMFAVQSNGDLTFCCLDHEGDTRVGNARTMPLADFFHHPDVLAAYRGFQRLRVVNPRCQQCLGEPGLLSSIGHQVGSIVYLKVYRKYFKKEIGA